MNRIILIGNGFDLAHGLPTKYEDFINWYWEKRVMDFCGNLTPISEDCLCTFKITTHSNSCAAWNVFIFNYPKFINRPSGKDIITSIIQDSTNYEVVFSPFFKIIYDSIESKGWVDIENEYYRLLRDLITNPDNQNYTVSNLNFQLQYIQGLLTEYLTSLSLNEINYDTDILKQIYSSIQYRDICISQLHTYYDYVNNLLHQGEMEYKRLLSRYNFPKDSIHFSWEKLKGLNQQYVKFSEEKSCKDIPEAYLKDLTYPESVLLLNFNYTGTADKYGFPKVATINHIHGTLTKPDSMIFGYGDELDEGYIQILKQEDNECLRNIKSIKYLESSNYRKMLQFIESAPYQIYIMGHSCGNSDRTLLNTLFEHRNCVSIKPYYHQKEDGSDNYMEIIQNICRNFTNMKLMRDRVVNKTFCEPLSQNLINTK